MSKKENPVNTKAIAHPWRRRIKRARRKLASATRAQVRVGGPKYGASLPALRELRRATSAWKHYGDVKTPKAEA